MLSPAGGRTTGQKGGATAMTKAKGGGIADHAGLVALPSICQRVGDLQEVGEQWGGLVGVLLRDWALPATITLAIEKKKKKEKN